MDIGMVGALAAILAPVFIIVAMGYGWVRIGQPFDTDLMTSIAYNVAAPCLIIATFARVDIDPLALAEVSGAAISAYIAFAAVGAAILTVCRLSLRSYLPSLMFPFVGGIGLPVVLFAFKDEGLAYALVFMALGAVGTFTIGMAIAAGKVSLGNILRTPAIYAVLIAILMMSTDLVLPGWVIKTTTLLGGILIPVQLISVGVGLASLNPTRIGRTFSLSVLRLGMGLGIGWGMAELFGLTGVARAVVIVQCAMPVATSNYIFAQLYKREPEEVASMVLISTLLAFVMLPVLLAVLI